MPGCLGNNVIGPDESGPQGSSDVPEARDRVRLTAVARSETGRDLAEALRVAVG
jgi:hypothetical protein